MSGSAAIGGCENRTSNTCCRSTATTKKSAGARNLLAPEPASLADGFGLSRRSRLPEADGITESAQSTSGGLRSCSSNEPHEADACRSGYMPLTAITQEIAAACADARGARQVADRQLGVNGRRPLRQSRLLNGTQMGSSALLWVSMRSAVVCGGMQNTTTGATEEPTATRCRVGLHGGDGGRWRRSAGAATSFSRTV